MIYEKGDEGVHGFSDHFICGGQYKYFGFDSCDHPANLFDFDLIESL